MNWPMWDTDLFLQINTVWISPNADSFFTTITDLHKVPLFALVVVISLGLLIYKTRKDGIKFTIGLIFCLGVTDTITYQLIKKSVQRERPALSLTEARPISPFGGKLSFPSNHAANTMAGAMFIALFYGFAVAIPFFIWAVLISYSRIYVGVHYPLDVLVGMLVGTLLAMVVFRSLRAVWQKDRSINV